MCVCKCNSLINYFIFGYHLSVLLFALFLFAVRCDKGLRRSVGCVSADGGQASASLVDVPAQPTTGRQHAAAATGRGGGASVAGGRRAAAAEPVAATQPAAGWRAVRRPCQPPPRRARQARRARVALPPTRSFLRRRHGNATLPKIA
jgi:hypothetical protein